MKIWVKIEKGWESYVKSAIEDLGLDFIKLYPHGWMLFRFELPLKVEIPPDVRHQLKSMDDVADYFIKLIKRIDHVLMAHKTFTVSIPRPLKAKRAYMASDEIIERIGLRPLHEKGLKGHNRKVGVCDTGIDSEHPDLSSYSIIEHDFTNEGSGDFHGHGTGVSSLIAYMAPEIDGIVMAKVLDKYGVGYSEQIIDGLLWLADEPVHAINMSLGTSMYSDGKDVLSETVNYVVKNKGKIVFVAAGNEGNFCSNIGSPGAALEAITVGAINNEDKATNFTSGGCKPPLYPERKPNVVAYGENILMARAKGTSMGNPIDTYYTVASGTSFSTPICTGASLCLSSLDNVKNRLMETATPVSTRTSLMRWVKQHSILHKIAHNTLCRIYKAFTGEDSINIPCDPECIVGSGKINMAMAEGL